MNVSDEKVAAAVPGIDQTGVLEVLVILQNQRLRGSVQAEMPGLKPEKKDRSQQARQHDIGMFQNDPVKKDSDTDRCFARIPV